MSGANESGICQSCHKRKKVRRRQINGQVMCDACWIRDFYSATCIDCGNHKPIAKQEPEGPICHNCRLKRYVDPEVCTQCGNRRRVNARTDEGGAVCGVCYKRDVRFNKNRNKASCTTCGKFKEVALRDRRGRPYCQACRIRDHTVIRCVRCRRNKPYGKKTPDGIICNNCNTAEHYRRKRAQRLASDSHEAV